MTGPDDTPDELDSIFIPDNLADDDAATAALRADIEKILAASDDDAPVLGDVPKAEDKTVSHETGLDLVDKARHSKPEAATPDPAADPAKAGDPPAEGDKPKDEGKTDPTPVDIKAAGIDALLDGLPDDRKGEISRRMGEADKVMSLFRGREAELERHGVDASTAMSRLIELNEFAQKHTDEYLAWVATQIDAKAPHEVMSKAAARLGYKLVPVEAEADDEFADPEVKRLREENRQLKAAATTEFGPDTAARKSQRDVMATLQNFIDERGADGKPLRPAFPVLRDRIAAMASERRRTTGQPVSMADLQEFYTKAEAEVKAALQVPAGGSAAQVPAPVPQQQKDQTAAAVEKAKAASKNIDGSGQGASRRPALSEDASIGDIIRHQLAKQSSED
jgi:hypothetical protein